VRWVLICRAISNMYQKSSPTTAATIYRNPLPAAALSYCTCHAIGRPLLHRSGNSAATGPTTYVQLPSNQLIRQYFPWRTDLSGCTRSKPSQGSVPVDLT
jgi:hypothetical protein